MSYKLTFMDDEDGNQIFSDGFLQWSVQGDKFFPMHDSIKQLPTGYYTVHFDPNSMLYYFKKRKIIEEELFYLPDDNFTKIIDDIKSFWKKEKVYKKYGYAYKRGILLHGPPGCGKTSLIQLLTHELMKKHDGVVVEIRSEGNLTDFDGIISSLRVIEPTRKLILIIEDIDNFSSDKENLTTLLNVLDGNMRIDNSVIVATTNFPEDLEERISNRPSRFDRRYEIPYPNEKIRRFYIESKLSKSDLTKIDIDEWIKKTEKFSIDHIKELILSVFILGYSFEDAYRDIKMMNSKRMGKQTGFTQTKF